MAGAISDSSMTTGQGFFGSAGAAGAGAKGTPVLSALSMELRRHSFLASGQVCRRGFLPMIEGAAELKTARRRR